MAVFHDLAPDVMREAKTDRFDDVGMVTRFGDTIFGLDLFDVVLFRLPRVTAAELLDCVEMVWSLAFSAHEFNTGITALANLFWASHGQSRGSLEFLFQRDAFDGKFVGDVGRKPT